MKHKSLIVYFVTLCRRNLFETFEEFICNEQ